MTNFAQSATFPIFSNQSGSESLGMANFTQFTTFLIFSNQSCSKSQPISLDSQLFLLKRLRMTQNGQFHLIHNFSNLFPPKWLVFGQISKFFIFWGGGGTLAKFSQICNFLNHFQLENDPQWPILPPKWLRLAQNGQFWSICNVSQVFPQKAVPIDSKWPISPDSQHFQSFPTKAAHFWQNLKIFNLGGYIELWSCQIYHKQGSCRAYGTAVHVEV